MSGSFGDWRKVFRGFQRVFQRPSQSPFQSAILLSELRVLLPLVVLPLKTPAREYKIPPPPEKPGKLLKTYNLAHPGTVLRITEKLLKLQKYHQKHFTFSNIFLCCVSVIFRTGPGCAKLQFLSNFPGFSGWGDFVFSKGQLGSQH